MTPSDKERDLVRGKREQESLCSRLGVPYVEAADEMKVGIADNVRSGLRPINGLRHPVQGDASGWYIWAGEELSGDADFFKPLHVSHLDQWCPGLAMFLGLPPGWRFQTDLEGHEEVWEDSSLLNV